MQYKLSHLEPKEPLRFFEEICQIPHGSHNEKAISEYLIAFAKARGLDCHTDEAWNVVIKKPGQGGGEGRAPLALQGHTDMVCEKNNDVAHDFLKDPIDYYLEGDLLRARGTTLGADNGTAVGMMLAILDDKTLAHPPLECLFTSAEEAGLVGALALSADVVTARSLINMDCGPEGVAVVGAAGGLRTDTTFAFEPQPVTGDVFVIEVKGLLGGHSGGLIHQYRGNANKLMARVLRPLMAEGIGVCSVEGGSKENAIPRECVATVSVPAGKQEAMEAILKQCRAAFQEELAGLDDGVAVVCSAGQASSRMDDAAAKALVCYLSIVPNGVQHFSQELDVTIASLNVAVLTTKEKGVTVTASIRSSAESLKDEIADRLQLLADLMGASMARSYGYPGWNYDRVSPLRDLAAKVWQRTTGSELVTKAVHGGLECGVFKQKWPTVDIIAIGPDANGAHSPDEELNLPSYARVYGFVREMVQELAKG